MMRCCLFLLIIFCTCCASPPCFAGENPFLSTPSSENEKTEQKKITYPSVVQSFIITLSRTQRSLNKELTHTARKIKNNPSAALLLTVISIAFIYGVIHALGPGHGKIFAMSYFLAEQGSIKRGLVFGGAFAFIHAGSAVLLVLVLYFILKCAVFRSVDDFSRWAKLFSYALIAALGAYMLIRKLKAVTSRKGNDTGRALIGPDKHPALMALAVGIVPCPGTVIVLLFALSLEMLSLGLALACAMAIGMAITISLIGIITITMRASMLGICAKSGKGAAGITALIESVGAFFILLAGSILFFSSL